MNAKRIQSARMVLAMLDTHQPLASRLEHNPRKSFATCQLTGTKTKKG